MAGKIVAAPQGTGGVIRRSGAGEVISAYASLFVSVTTLICCALPALLVLLGFGVSAVLTVFTAVPGWEKLGQYTMPFFGVGAFVLSLGFYFAYRKAPGGSDVCELPAGGGESACSTATRWNRRLLWLSLSLYLVAFVTDMWGITWMRTHGYFNR